jgi:DNA-binding PucR family transcriptional regulator
VPEKVVAVAVESTPDSPVVLGPGVLADLGASPPCLVVDAAFVDTVGSALPGRRMAVGPTVPVERAPKSLAVATRALALIHRGVLTDRVLRCDDHLPALVLLADEYLLAQITEQTLAVFADLTPKQRGRLTATLLAWLETRGGVTEIAARLAVHPQTVRYRMHQLEELLGDRLDDPGERLGMEIALRGHVLLNPPGAAEADSA